MYRFELRLRLRLISLICFDVFVWRSPLFATDPTNTESNID